MWESILGLQEDIVFVSRDNAYHEHSIFLQREFEKATGKTIVFEKYISSALKILGKTLSPDLQAQEEEAFPVDSIHIPGDWQISRIENGVAHVALRDHSRFGITPVGPTDKIDFSWLCPHCMSYGPWNGSRCMTCGRLSDPND